MNILAGDVGGTKIRLALFSLQGGRIESIHQAVFSSRNHRSLKHVLNAFMSEVEVFPKAAAFVLAGPVVGDTVEITNLEWKAKKGDVREVLGDLPIGFYNDLAGLSNFVPFLGPEDLVVLNPGNPLEGGAKAVIAPGTGLGEGFLVSDGTKYFVQASEGGHTDFGPTNEIQDGLLNFMRKRYNHVSYERVCSGSAIPDLYDFLKDRESWEEPGWFRKALDDAVDKSPVIVDAAFNPERHIPLCRQVVDLFVEILASEAGNLALKVMALGGVYLAGGVSMKIIPALDANFGGKFSQKGRFSEILEAIPVYLVTHPEPALYGAAHFAFRLAGITLNQA